MRLPLILVNFKCYKEATGNNALKLAKICKTVSKEYKVNIAIAPQYTDIFRITSKLRIEVFGQHIDTVDPGAHTGHITALSLKKARVIGSLINHSERRLSLREINECIRQTKKHDLISIVCSDSIMKVKNIAMFEPDFIAYEPPELIGTGVSVSKTKPRVVSETVKIIKRVNPEIKVLCGAGITDGEDVRKALELGTVGVLVASGVVKKYSPKEILTEFAKAVKSYE